MEKVIRKCRKCKEPLTKKNWYPSDRKNYIYLCKSCKAKERAENFRKSPKQQARHRKTAKKSREKLRAEVLRHYSGGTPKCQRCGFADIRALQIDHKDGKGAKHRKQIGTGSMALYTWLRKNNYPKGFQVLCANCNQIKRIENREFGYLDEAKEKLKKRNC